MMNSIVLEVDLDKIRTNTARIVEQCHAQGIAVLGVTKGFTAIHQIVAAMIEGGVDGLADSRLENIEELRSRGFGQSITLLRIPRLSNVKEVVRYADVSVNSEITVIEALGQAAWQAGRVHQVILMVDVGDLREGVLQGDVLDSVERISRMKGVYLQGLGTNMGCFGGILPEQENLSVLVNLKNTVQDKLGITIDVISGGGTSSLLLVESKKMPAGVNQLRIGEGILLGTDTTNSRIIPGLCHDAFRLRAEVIEVKYKPSVPIGNVGRDAFGNIPHFVDKGIRNRAILALGKQDVNIDGVMPVDANIEVMGASSDHLIVDITDSQREIHVGDEMSFHLTYAGLLSACDSKYVKKEYKEKKNND